MRKISYSAVAGSFVKHRALLKKIFILGIITTALLIIGSVATYAHFAKDIGDRDRLMNRNNTGFVLLDKNGEIIYSYGRVNYGKELTLEEISDNLENALIASEDKEFYKHDGFSVRGIAGALGANILNKDATRYGGSTITQQLIKNNLLTTDRSFLRKYQEFSMAIAAEGHYSKEEILEMYLNSVYFGEGAFGVGAAAKTYFNKAPNDLTVAESSMLIGVLPAPSAYSPITGDKTKAKEQQKEVLQEMVKAGFLTSEQAEAVHKEEISYQEPQKLEQKHAQHFAYMVLDELKQKYGEEAIVRGGYQVTTSLDLNWQRQAEQLVRERVAELSNLGGTNAGLVAIDPKNGEIRALVGSVNWEEPVFGKVNMALMPRQPGSSFKPIYYTESMDKKLITPATILKDEPKAWDTYRPQNYDFRFRGDISVRRALALSLNIPAVEVMQKMGVQEASQTAQRLGISTVTEPDKYGLSLALGTAEVKLLEMTNAYATLANQGNQFSASNIQEIKDKFDRPIYKHRPQAKRVMSEEASFLTSSILSDQEARAPTFGSSLLVDGRVTASKTGTTDNNRDAWTIGYTPSLAVGVWVGNNENKPMSGVAGSSGAAPIWRRSMKAFLANSPAENFSQPKNVVQLQVCARNGLPTQRETSGTYKEYFIKGAEPAGRCDAPEKKSEQKEEKKEERKEESEKKEEKKEENENNSDEGGRGSGSSVPPSQPIATPTTETPPEDNDEGSSPDPAEPPPDPSPPPPSEEPTPTQTSPA